MNGKNDFSRRDFMKWGGAAGMVLAVPAGLAPLAEAASPSRYRQSQLKMGTIVTLTAVDVPRKRAQEAFAAAFAEMDRLIAVFDRHQAGTDISRLNQHGRLEAPTPEMVAVLDLAAEVHRASDGGFDPTVLPLLSLIESSFSRNGHPPSEDRLRQIAATVDFQGVRYDRTSVNLGRKDRRISLDGVAKGFIVDRAGKVLKEAGVSNALINAGGDILALGRREGGRPWRIGIQDPFESGRHLKVVNLTDQAVATSGSYEIFFDKKRDYHHLLNPKDAKPSVSLVSATTLASSAAQADALATAAFVRPDVLEATETDGLIVTPSGHQISTAGFRRAVAS